MIQVSKTKHHKLAEYLFDAGKSNSWNDAKLKIILNLSQVEFNAWVTTCINEYEPAPVKIQVVPQAPLRIDRSNPFNPAEFFKCKWSIPKNSTDSFEDLASLVRENIHFHEFTKDNFVTGLRGTETRITGMVKRERLMKKGVQPDAKIGQTLYEEEGQKTLRWIYDNIGISWFELLGTILLHSNRSYYVMYLYRKEDDGSWGCGHKELKESRDETTFAMSL